MRAPLAAARALLAPALLAATAAHAAPADEVASLLAAPAPPPGVVFEVVTGDEAALERALPAIRGHVARLRERFPALPVTVLAHGAEQFSLLGDNAGRYAELHALVGAMREADDVPVQVCGNHASWRGKLPQDFPPHVEVVSSASGALADYRAAGWTVIVM